MSSLRIQIPALLGVLFLVACGSTAQATCISVSVPDSLDVAPGSLVDVPISTSPGVEGTDVIGFLAVLHFDLGQLEFVEILDCVGGVAYPPGWRPLTSNVVGNELRVAGAEALALEGGGCLFVARFRVLETAPAATCSAIELTQVLFNAGTPCTTLVSGSVCVACR
ncbi:MAG: hypothetical protein ACE5G2_02575 [Candidatus Krumholzibacteriia bacterium]